MEKLIENQTISNLRRSGFKVRVLHQRYNLKRDLLPRKDLKSDNLLPKGGVTTIQVSSKDGLEYEGVSHCSLSDSFNRKLGNQIALGRLKQTNK